MNTKERVENLMGRFPQYRDSDCRLWAAMVWQELPEFLKGREVKAFLEMYCEGKFVDSSTVRRERQKAEETHPHLRGKTYDKRQRKGEATREKISTEKAESECPGYL